MSLFQATSGGLSLDPYDEWHTEFCAANLVAHRIHVRGHTAFHAEEKMAR